MPAVLAYNFNCGRVTRIERGPLAQSGDRSGTWPVPIPTVKAHPAKHASRSTFGLRRQIKAAIVAGVLFGVFGIGVALDRLWPDSSEKLGTESSSTVKQPVAPSPTTQPQDSQPSLVVPIPPISNASHQRDYLSSAPSSPDDVAAPPTTSSVRSLPRSATEFPPIPALGYHVNFSANWISLGSVDVEVSKPATPVNTIPLESSMSVLSGVTGTAKFA